MTLEFKKLKAGDTVEAPSRRRYTLASDPTPGRSADSHWSAAVEGGGRLHWDPYGKLTVVARAA